MSVIITKDHTEQDVRDSLDDNNIMRYIYPACWDDPRFKYRNLAPRVFASTLLILASQVLDEDKQDIPMLIPKSHINKMMAQIDPWD